MKVNKTLAHFYHYAFPMQTALVTCNDDKGKTNIITLAWHTPISRTPPLYGISLSPKRYSYDCIQKTKEFVINFIPYALAPQAHYCGTHSGRNNDKAKNTHLTLTPSTKLKTPLIAEGYAHLECTLVKTIPIGDHDLIIGEVVAATADDHAFTNDLLNIEQQQPLYYIGDNKYTTLDPAARHEF